MTNLEPTWGARVLNNRWALSLGGVALTFAVLALLRLAPAGRAVAQQPGRAAANAPAASNYAPVKPAVAKPNTPNPVRPAAAPVANNTLEVNSAPASSVKTPPVKELAIMAAINGEAISREDLGRECVRRYGEEVLESMINRLLIQQACQRANITITEKDVDDEITRIAEKFKLPVDRWMELLKEERNVSPDQYRKEIVWPTLALRLLAADQIKVEKAELQQAFESEFGPRVRVRIIITSREAVAREAHAKAKAQPKQFAEIAKQYCEDPNIASVGGAIPPIRKHVGDPQLEQVAFALQPGQVSDVVKSQNQYFILLCEVREPERFVSPQQMKQVEEDLADRLRDQKLRTASQDLFAKLQKEAKMVNVLANAEMRAKYPDVAATINGRNISMSLLTDECLTRHGRDVLEGEINRKLLQQALTEKNLAIQQADIDAEIDQAAISFNCVKRDGSPDREKWLKQVQEKDGATIDLYIRDAVWPSVALKKLVEGSVQVTNEDLQKGFESNYGPRVEVLAIVLSDLRQAQKVWEMARNNPSDRAFGELAGQYSVEPVSRGNQGKVPPVRRFGGQPIVETEAFKMKPGDLSTILTVGDKYVILRCVGKTQPVVTSLAEVKSELEKDLFEKKQNLQMTQTFERLRETAQIDNFLAGTSQSGKRSSTAQQSGATPTARVGSLNKPAAK